MIKNQDWWWMWYNMIIRGLHMSDSILKFSWCWVHYLELWGISIVLSACEWVHYGQTSHEAIFFHLGRFLSRSIKKFINSCKFFKIWWLVAHCNISFNPELVPQKRQKGYHFQSKVIFQSFYINEVLRQ